MHPLLITDVFSKYGCETPVFEKMFTSSSLHVDIVYWSCMGFPNIISTHVYRVATRAGAPLVVPVLGTTGSEIVS